MIMKETRIVFGPEDVCLIGLQCKECTAEIMISAEKARPFPLECPLRHEPWQGDRRVEAAKDFLDDLQALKAQPSDKVAVRLVADG